MRKLLCALLAVAGVAALSPDPSYAERCASPNAQPLWTDVVGGPFWKKIWGRRGVIVATGSISVTGGPDIPTQLRAAGATTIYWDLHLRNRVGTPSRPADPKVIVERANRFFDYTVRATDCSRPLIGLNELFGASTPTPWTPTNAQYRANVLLFLRTLATRGATPYLAVPVRPYTGGEAGDWWREVGLVAHIVREVYVPAPLVHSRGPVAGSRLLRESYRRGVLDFSRIGIPTRRIGLFLGFQTTRGHGGREGLKPADAWFRVVKLQALAAKQVAAELRIGSIWSWGWSSWRTTPQEMDPDKEAAACVYLWASRRACDGPASAGPGFNASLTEGQIRLPSGVYCRVGGAEITNAAVRQLARLVGDIEPARSLLFAQSVVGRAARVERRSVMVAERAVVEGAFGGGRIAYLAALARAGVPLPLARGAIASELARAKVEARFHVGRASGTQVVDYYNSYAISLARRVRVRPRATWLGGRATGLALEPVVPKKFFVAPAGRWFRFETAANRYRVRPLGPARALSSFPLSAASPAITAALASAARARLFDTWLVRAQTRALRLTICRRDDLPAAASLSLADYVPFLRPTPSEAPRAQEEPRSRTRGGSARPRSSRA